jgi:flagellar biosynthesis chaperone FliJ
MKMEQLSLAPDANRLITPNYSENMQSTLILSFSASKIEEYQKQIEQLQHSLSQQDEQQTLLEKHLNEVEHELNKTSDDYASTMAKYESLVKQQSIQSTTR